MATTASGENAQLVRSLGADVVVDYTKEDFDEVLVAGRRTPDSRISSERQGSWAS